MNDPEEKTQPFYLRLTLLVSSCLVFFVPAVFALLAAAAATGLVDSAHLSPPVYAAGAVAFGFCLLAAMFRSGMHRRQRRGTAELTGILGQIQDAVLLFDGSQEIRYANNSARELLSKSMFESLRFRLTHILKAMDSVTAEELQKEALDAAEVVLNRPLGPGRVSLMPVRDAGRIDGAALIIRRGEPAAAGASEAAQSSGTEAGILHELSRMSKQYEIIFNSVPAMIWYKDGNNRIIRANEYAAKSVGRTVKEVEGASTFDLYPEHAADYYADDLSVIKSGRPKLGIVERYKPVDGPALWIRTDKIPFYGESGKVEGVIVFSIDITEAKQSEERLRRAGEELQRMNSELQVFNHMVSHDLLEPVRTMTGFADMICRSPDNASVGEYSKRILDAGLRMRKQLKDLLQYVKLYNEDSHFEACSIGRIIRDVLLDLEGLVRETGAKIHVGSVTDVWGNQTQLYHLFINLLTNSIKFREEGKTPEIWIDAAEENEGIVISIRDNGIGFEPQFSEKIFAPFQKLNPRDAYPGTGMGLSICKRIVEVHKGSIRAQSERQAGAVFEIRLQKAKAARVS